MASHDPEGAAGLRLAARGPVNGTVTVPGDKSISHRAAIVAACSEGESRIDGFAPGLDCRSTLECLRQLGVEIRHEGTSVLVRGGGIRALREPDDVIFAGNSGTTMRLLAGVLAACPFLSVMTGDQSLRRRPMNRIKSPLEKMGATVLARGEMGFPPLVIRGGTLRGIRYELPVASAQVKSAILLAGLFADGPTAVIEPARSRDHTERMLSCFEVRIERHDGEIKLDPPAKLTARYIAVPGDISSAAFLIGLALITGDSELVVEGVGLNPTRTAFLDILCEMDADLEWSVTGESTGEPVGYVKSRSSRLRGIHVGGDVIPLIIDEIPILAVIATQASGRTTIRDASELRVKESDRLKAISSELSKMGARVMEEADGLTIYGPTRLRGATLNSYGDHRIAMALAIAASIAEGESFIMEPECIDISYPGFIETLGSLRGGVP